MNASVTAQGPSVLLSHLSNFRVELRSQGYSAQTNKLYMSRLRGLNRLTSAEGIDQIEGLRSAGTRRGHGIYDPPALFTPDRSSGGNVVVAKAKKTKPFSVGEFLSTINGERRVTEYRKNQKIFSQGDTADAVYYVQQGQVKVCVISEQGKEAVVALHGKGDFFGEGCLTGQPIRLATVAAIANSTIMRIDKAAVVRVLKEEPKFTAMFLSYILARNARVEEDLVDQLFNSSEKRLARVLLLMANYGKEGRREPVLAKISQETLAEMVGTTRSRVSYFMNKFRRLGFIEYNGTIEIHNSLLTVILNDNPRLRTDADDRD